MKNRSLVMWSLLVVSALSAARPSSASAQAAGAQPAAPKIAVANPSKIFLGMKEKTDVQQKLAQQRDALVAEGRSRGQKVEDLKAAMELLKPDAPQYEEANKQFVTAAIEFKNWRELSEQQSARNEKLQTKMLFDKITTQIADVAKERGIDLVIAEQPPVDIEKINAEQLTQLMAQRQVLYTNATADVTNDVITKLDERYNVTNKK